MLGGKIVDGQQGLTIFDQAFDRLVILNTIGFDESVERFEGIPFWCRPSRSPAAHFWLLVVGSSAIYSGCWPSYAPSSAGHSCWAILPQAPAKIPMRRRQPHAWARWVWPGGADRAASRARTASSRAPIGQANKLLFAFRCGANNDKEALRVALETGTVGKLLWSSNVCLPIWTTVAFNYIG
jgi:hypothetical protein